MKFVYKEYVLRKAEPRDAAELIRITNEDEIMKYYGESGAYLKNEEEALQAIYWYNNQLSKHAGMWVIAQQSTGEYIGDIGFNDFVKEHNKAEVGYKLKKEYWGKGIISSFYQSDC